MNDEQIKVSIIFLIKLTFAIGIKDGTELKMTYYEDLIKNEIERAENYKLPKDNSNYFKNATGGIKEFGTFDFIVVGAGSSGSVIASRLSEVEGFNILLLEAGGWDDDLTAIPYMSPLLHRSDRNWGYYTTQQENGCYGWKGRRCAFQRGKLVGGSGSINSMTYVRGNKEDYDNWESLGNPGWSFKNVLPYFKKFENFESKNIDLNYRGFAGPVNSIQNKVEEYFDRFSDQLIELGQEIIEDYNAEKQIGASKNQRNIELGRRVSGATAYVRPSITRKNFNVTVRALVTKILINKFTKTAYGVKFIKNGQRYRALAEREVVLSAGAINSPQLLMLSGVGPIDELKKHNIPVISNLPVGKQLKDHFLLRISYKYNSTIKYVSLREAIREYLNGEGILTRPANGFGFSFINTRNISSLIPNIEISYYHPSPLNQNFPCQCNFTDDFINYQTQLSDTFNIALYVLHPKSSGTLKLQSNRIMDYPLIDIGIFREVEDMETLYEGVKFITQIEETKSPKKVIANIVKLPMCQHYRDNSKEYWFCAFKYLTYPGLHVSTTAKMGPKNDPFAVVDYQLRVYGIKRLRVADCSIMPTPISGHTGAAAFMIGEKAATLLKEDNSL